MKLWHLACATMALGLACGTSDDGPQSENADASGTLQLALVGTDSTGTQYRLRNGEFYIEGYPDYYDNGSGGTGSYFFEVVSTEDDPNAPTIRKRVVPGYYSVNFVSEDWYFERLTPGGPQRVERAVLLSSRYRSGRVYDGGVANFSYQFGVDGDIIDFRSGDIDIRIDIERPEDGVVGGGGAGGGGSVILAGAGGAPN